MLTMLSAFSCSLCLLCSSGLCQGLESAMGHRGASPNISYIEDPHNPVKPRTGGVQLLGMPFQGLGHVCVGGGLFDLERL